MVWIVSGDELHGQPARKRGPSADPRLNDLVLRRDRGETWFKKAKRQALDGLYAHLCDPDDPIILNVLRERTDPPPAPLPMQAMPWDVTIPAVHSAGSPLDDSPEFAERTDEDLRSSAPDSSRYPGEFPPLFSWDITQPLPSNTTTIVAGTTRFPWLPVNWRRWLSIVVAFAILFAVRQYPRHAAIHQHADVAGSQPIWLGDSASGDSARTPDFCRGEPAQWRLACALAAAKCRRWRDTNLATLAGYKLAHGASIYGGRQSGRVHRKR